MFGSTLTSLIVSLGMLAAAPGVLGHMEMTSPPPLGSINNKFTPQSAVDYDMKSPLSPDGSNYPCRGHLNLLNTDAGQSVATWAAGSTQSLTIAGSASHGGGSCQAMLSYDSGKSWTVIKSWIGNCPATDGGSFSFQVPADAPAGDKVIFAWSWFNKLGNREMYENCAAITITGGGGNAGSTPFSSRPGPFLANIGNGCATVEGGDVMFPNPGPDVDNTSGGTNQPTGNCGSGSGGSVPAPAPEASSAAPASQSSAATPSAGQNNNAASTEAPASTTDAAASSAAPAPSTDAAAPSSAAASASASDAAASTDSTAPPTTTSTRPKKQCKRYRKRAHPRRTQPLRAHF